MDLHTKKDLKKLKKTLMEKAGLAQEPLTAGKLFMTCSQRPVDKIADIVSDLFKREFPDEDLTRNTQQKEPGHRTIDYLLESLHKLC